MPAIATRASAKTMNTTIARLVRSWFTTRLSTFAPCVWCSLPESLIASVRCSQSQNQIGTGYERSAWKTLGGNSRNDETGPRAKHVGGHENGEVQHQQHLRTHLHVQPHWGRERPTRQSPMARYSDLPTVPQQPSGNKGLRTLHTEPGLSIARRDLPQIKVRSRGYGPC